MSKLDFDKEKFEFIPIVQETSSFTESVKQEKMNDLDEQVYLNWRNEKPCFWTWEERQKAMDGLFKDPPSPAPQEEKGSPHYRTNGVELWDLFVAGGLSQDSAITSIMRYAFRCRPQADRSVELQIKDFEKIIHYAELYLKELRNAENKKLVGFVLGVDERT